jgi:hypothetical protein
VRYNGAYSKLLLRKRRDFAFEGRYVRKKDKKSPLGKKNDAD